MKRIGIGNTSMTQLQFCLCVPIALCVYFLLRHFSFFSWNQTASTQHGISFSGHVLDEGNAYSIFKPYYGNAEGRSTSKAQPPLIGSAKDFIDSLLERVVWVNGMVDGIPARYASMDNNVTTPKDHAVFLYTEMIKSFVSATVFNDAEFSVHPRLGSDKKRIKAFNKDNRMNGQDWTYVGDTMTGWKRLDNVRNLLMDVVRKNVKGDYIETGVWRGGSSIFARAVMDALGEHNRTSYVCDSFQGLPPGEKHLDEKDIGWDKTPYLEVSSEVVANNFRKYGLLGLNVVFAKGFFNETMPPLSKRIDSLSIMRLDGDMYESTVDVLYHLYDKLSIGGYVIMDDWFGFPSRTACEDFFKVHGINPTIVPIDKLSAYWKKTEDVSIQYWRYEQSKFKD